MEHIFLSKNPRYKQPYGAVPTGQGVSLAVRPPRALGVRAARLICRYEQRDAELVTEMAWASLSHGRDKYTARIDTDGYVGLVWYRFELDTALGTRYLGPEGLLDGLGGDYQLTVYRPDFQEIPWFSGGIVYQIYPDRYHRTKNYPLAKNKWLHEDWYEPPAHTPSREESTGRELWNCDFFGGSLDGITAKLDHLAELGVTVLYLNPIFEAFSNHRYDTGCYERIDPLLGTEGDFRRLCREAHRRGMRIILDGVFNHTGSDSMYFNQDWTYDTMGACQSKESPYYPWYEFQEYPHRYTAWWGIKTLPSVNELTPGYLDYIIRDENSIIRRWLRDGADGWRLDVADELPDEFIALLHRTVKAENPEAIVIGEVWEDATNKMAYGQRREHLWGGHLDSVMNYPFKDAAIGYLKDLDAGGFRRRMEDLRENYPPAAFMNNMNFLGTHDTPRILTVLGANTWPEGREAQAAYTLSQAEYDLGKRRLKLAAILLMTFPGAPTIYYGDEAGLTGFADPFNRGTYPWGREDTDLLDWYRLLTGIRQKSQPLLRGNIHYLAADGPILAYTRRVGRDRVLVAVNAGDTPRLVELPWRDKTAVEQISGLRLYPAERRLRFHIPPYYGMIVSR